MNCQYTMFGTSDIGHSFNVVELGGPMPWDDMARYIERSPLTYAKDVVTPLLIIHSEDDLRCPIEQGEQLFVALKKLRREVRFIRFPGENHEMSRSGKPRHRLGYDEDLRRCCERFKCVDFWTDEFFYATSISIYARRRARPVRPEKRSATRICQPYFARSAPCARSITAGSVIRRAVAARAAPCTRPRESDGATRAFAVWRKRLTFPESPMVNT